MKRNYITYFILAIFAGAVAGRVIYWYSEQKNTPTFNSYFIKYGTYDNAASAKEASGKLESSTIVYKNNKYDVYVGVSTNYSNAKKIEEAFKAKNINVTIEKSVIDNVEFMSNLEQYDILLTEVTETQDVFSITDVILSSFEEMIPGK